MDKDASVPVEANAQEYETADFHHPLSKNLEDAEHNQDKNEDEHTEGLEDKPAEPEGTTDTNKLDHNNENTVDPALLQSDEPKSKVIDGTGWNPIALICSCIIICMSVTRSLIARKSGKIQM